MHYHINNLSLTNLLWEEINVVVFHSFAGKFKNMDRKRRACVRLIS